MKKYDFFVSYSSKDSDIVQGIVADLEGRGLKCWYAPRDVVGRYAKSIVDAIESSRIFLVCLSKNSAVSEHVLNEVEMVYNKMRSSNGDIIIEPLCLENLDMDSSEYDEMMYYIRRINFISPKNYSSPVIIAEEIYNKNRNVLGLGEKDIPRDKVGYVYSKGEKERLALQNQLLRKYDQDVYKEVFQGRNHLDILDVGCGNADVIFDRLQLFDGSFTLIGIERDPNLISEAKANHGEETAFYLQADVESPEFIDDLMDLMDEKHIDGFDFIHVSMCLMYLKDMGKLFRKLKRLLNKGGVILIKDVDDGLNFAYPDNEHSFERLYKMCARNKAHGYRLNGRQVPHILLKTGFNKVSLKKQGMTTLDMSEEEREVLFDMYFKPVFSGADEASKNNPGDLSFAEDAAWANDHYNDVRNAFFDPDFVFSLGIVIILAEMAG